MSTSAVLSKSAKPKKSKKVVGSKQVVVEPTNLLGQGVAAAARFINAVNIQEDAYDVDSYFDEPVEVGKLSGRCFI